MLRIPVEAHAVADHSVWIDIDTGALAHNVRALRSRLAPSCELIAVVKANAYGHGAVAIARAVLAAGAGSLAVGRVDEGVELRAAGIAAPIAVIGPVAPGEAAAAVAAGLEPTLATMAQLDAFSAAAGRDGLDCHVEVDTGMRRHGIDAAGFAAFVRALRARGRLRLRSVFTHFAGLDVAAVDSMRAQLRCFEATLARVRDLGAVRRHACNTHGMCSLPEAHLDAVRVGGGLYGFAPPGGTDLGLRPVLSLRARCVLVRDVARGERVGYGSTLQCARPSRLALLPIGYADGLARDAWHDAEVLVRGRRASIAGLISMNQMLVDVTDVTGVAAGDIFALLGRDGDATIAAEERVRPGGSVYEVTSLLRAGLPRFPVAGG